MSNSTAHASTSPSTPPSSETPSGRSALAEQSSKVAEDVKELGNVTLRTAGDALQGVRDRGSQAVDRGRERAGEARDDIEGFIRDHPIRSIFIAAGVGALVGFLTRR